MNDPGCQVFKCSICDYKCEKEGTFRNHFYKIHHNAGHRHSFKTKHAVDRSIRNQKYYEKLKEQQLISEATLLLKQTTQDTNNKVFKCTICDYTCEKEGTLQKHFYRIHHSFKSKHAVDRSISDQKYYEKLKAMKEKHSYDELDIIDMKQTETCKKQKLITKITGRVPKRRKET